ncbi:minor capsid protein [Streptomyces sp. A0592]|uniref:minor capsid protein n=1 Tax=Streptomyces sp. A0592 TaxID=2563099 RepID=UPI0019D0AAF1|nr:minor capsid protein [Streptomyces sp. A0592]
MSQRVTMRWDGDRLWTSRGRRLAEEGVQKSLEHVLGESNKTVPLREGTLERSGRVVRDGLNGQVQYDTVYARRQHEELTWKHLPGRRAKYLELALLESAAAVRELMRVSLWRWLRG